MPKPLSRILYAVLFLLPLASVYGQEVMQSLNSSAGVAWTFYFTAKHKTYPATVPGNIYTDLLANNLIPDPFYSDNEKKIQWVDSTGWGYSACFNIDDKWRGKKKVTLVMEGLDTYATVILNNRTIVSGNNMFVTYTADVTKFLKPGSNSIQIIFAPASRVSNNLKHRYENKHHYTLPEGERVFTRKAQYQFGWDFAPCFLGCGIWRDIKLVAGDSITPHKVVADNHLELVQEKDSIGRSFYFKKDGKPIFIKGANWVPADIFPSRVTHDKYRYLLCSAKEAGINMLRVWGGGIYEDDYFYDLCDSLNIMVWQDFMFACAMYPGDNAFLNTVKQEIKQNVLRLQRHPCIAIWCGNNEIDEGWHNWGWQKQYHYTAKDSAEIWNNYNKLFKEVIPQILKECGSTVAYIPTSPQIGWGHKESLTTGDSHYWGVWWGMEPYETYSQKVPRFASEYGMQSMPCIATVKTFAADTALNIHSAAIRNHQKHPTGFQNLDAYLKMYNLYPTDTASITPYLNATQQLQADALNTAITAHLKAQPRCMGTMLWQFNDCWPVASWSIIDYYGNKKKAYYVVKKLYTK